MDGVGANDWDADEDCTAKPAAARMPLPMAAAALAVISVRIVLDDAAAMAELRKLLRELFLLCVKLAFTFDKEMGQAVLDAAPEFSTDAPAQDGESGACANAPDATQDDSRNVAGACALCPPARPALARRAVRPSGARCRSGLTTQAALRAARPGPRRVPGLETRHRAAAPQPPPRSGLAENRSRTAAVFLRP